MDKILRFAIVALLAFTYVIIHPDEAFADNAVVNNCSVYLDLPDYLTVNDNDDDNDEISDMDIRPAPSVAADSVVGEMDTVKITVVGTADKKAATVTVTLLPSTDAITRIDGFWPGTTTITGGNTTGNEPAGEEKRSTKASPFTFTVPAGTTVTQTLYIEGIKNSAAKNDVQIQAVIDSPADTTSSPPILAAHEETYPPHQDNNRLPSGSGC